MHVSSWGQTAEPHHFAASRCGQTKRPFAGFMNFLGDLPSRGLLTVRPGEPGYKQRSVAPKYISLRSTTPPGARPPALAASLPRCHAVLPRHPGDPHPPIMMAPMVTLCVCCVIPCAAQLGRSSARTRRTSSSGRCSATPRKTSPRARAPRDRGLQPLSPRPSPPDRPMR